jgi:hypothetical protein
MDLDELCENYLCSPNDRDSNTHCARRPSCVMVTMILSLNEMEVTSVTMPLISPTTCFVFAGYGRFASDGISAIP